MATERAAERQQAEDAVQGAGRHWFAQLNHEGDTRVEWDPTNEDEVEAARGAWERLVGGKGYSAFEVGTGGKAGQRVQEFDPNLRRVVLIPPMAGGSGR